MGCNHCACNWISAGGGQPVGAGVGLVGAGMPAGINVAVIGGGR